MALPVVFAQYRKSLASAEIDYDSATVRVAAGTAFANVDTHQQAARYFDDLSTDFTESTTGGYAAGGVALTGLSYTQSGDSWFLNSDDPTLGSGVTVRYLVWYVDSGDPATSPLIQYQDLGTTMVLDTVVNDPSGFLDDGVNNP